MNPTTLTPAQRKMLVALAKLPDCQIDYSDIPPLTEAFCRHAVRNLFRRRPAGSEPNPWRLKYR